MMELFLAFFIVVGTALSSVRGHAIPQNCSARYQSALREALDIKEECEDAAAYDCCQILNTLQMINTVEDLYKTKSGVNLIGQVCSENEYPFLAHDIHGEMKARCDMETDEGGWLVIQRKVMGGTGNFGRKWAEYRNGFGDLNGEFWYGLENMHCLTERDDVELRIDFTKDGTNYFWTYQQFKVAGETDNYRLTIAQGDGNYSLDFMVYHNNRPFTTQDEDNDDREDNCAIIMANTGWWFGSCYTFNPNNSPNAMIYNGAHIAIDSVEMKIRPKSCIQEKPNKCN